MPARDALWRDYQRTRWLKPDAHRWIKPDASRFLKPGVAIGAVLPAFEAKYNPDQPREPAGSPEGGQWAGGAGKEGGDIAFDEPDFDLGAWLDSLFEDLPDFDLASILTFLAGDSSDGAGDFTFIVGDELQVDPDSVLLVQNRDGGLPIDLFEEQALGGHAIEQHVGRSQQSLIGDVRDTFASSERRGNIAEGVRQGSFSSMEAANKLVNSTIAQNPDKIDRIIRGVSPKEELDASFAAPTGYEAYGRNARSQVVIRDTYGVRVVVVPSSSSPRGYRVDSAFPRNSD